MRSWRSSGRDVEVTFDVGYTTAVKLLSSDTCLEAQQFLVNRLKLMSPERRLQVTAATISAGLKVHNPEMTAMDPFEVTAKVTEFLEQNQVEYFLGGSLASTVHGEPRFTQNVDIVVRLGTTQSERMVSALGAEFYLSEEALNDALTRGGSANLIHFASNFKIDLILSGESEFERSEFQRKVRISVGDRSFYFCSAEDIILAKLDWYKKSGGILEGQLRDIQTVLMVQSPIDASYLRQWADKLGVRQQLEMSMIDAGL